MTDFDDEKITMDPLPERCKMREDPSLQPDRILCELRGSHVVKDLEVFRTLINIKSQSEDGKDAERATRWKPVIVQLLRLLVSSEEVGDERVLLGSLAFVTVLFTNCQLEDFTDHLRTYWSLETPVLSAFGEDFQIRDLEWFKLVITHGYLNVNIDTIYTSQIFVLPFDVSRRNCLRYTKYSYFAYKTLQSWLDKSAKTNFWYENDTSGMEKELETIIFSNWDSSICEIARRNATDVFPTYLKIMSDKYEGFSHLIFENCVQNLSWQNETKYRILSEVCKIWKDLPKIVSSDLPACIFTSLTKNHLKHAGTKLYLTILNMLKADEWESVFGESFLRISGKWEEEEQLVAIQLLWEQWMKPTMAKFSQLFQYLWKNDSMKQLELSRTYLERIGDGLGFELIYDDTNIRDVLSSRIEDISEHVRLNAFAIICQNKNWTYVDSEDEPFAVAKRFLYLNIDTSSVTMRKVIIKNFLILIGNMQKFDDKSRAVNDLHDKVSVFRYWLHEFLLDCLEIGSCYQRKILALSLYEVILDVAHRETLAELRTVRLDFIEHMNRHWSWKFVERRSLIVFFRLVLDQMADVRDKSAHIITNYSFDQGLTFEEHKTLKDLTYRYCNSSKFYEAASGSTMRRVQSTWRDPHLPPEAAGEMQLLSFSVSALTQAKDQLKKMQHSRDILNCAVNGSPFFGSMMTILELAFLGDPPRHLFVSTEVNALLNLAEKATDFFLSALSSKATQIEYSSSFEEMGLAIEESIRNSEVNEDAEECILSSSHQLVVSCIWMSLKVCCEVAAMVGVFADKDEKEAKRAADLIVSVLLKCRHKGAIEAAGLALAKLTKAVCKTYYTDVIENHLSDLLNIDDKDNINLTRRGAGLSIMFHRIVSSDDRKNRPMLHFAVKKLLNSLETQADDTSNIQEEDCLRDSSRSRHLHFLRSLVADKSLQAQLVPYMEDICLTCFEYLQSPEWIVRNASLQLFGAIVPRLVGQCGARELDYGIGNSVDHFVTHYPILANSVLTQLESLAASIDTKKNLRCANLHIDSNVVSILTLFLKMSTGGCDLVDYSSKNYILRAKCAFVLLFGHPVFHVRVLASKAYAAFVALPDIPRVLATMKLEMVDDKSNNYQHGQLSAQIYLGRKLEHEMQCTSETFFIRKHKIHEAELKRGLDVQLRRFRCILKHWFDCDKWQFCYMVHSTLIRCLIESRTFLSSFNLRPEVDKSFIDNFHDFVMEPGVTEFAQNLEAFYDQYNRDISSATLEFEYRQYKNDLILRKDDSSSVSRIRMISEKLYDDDVDVKGFLIASLPRLVDDAIISASDRGFTFDPQSEYSKLWIEVIIAMLTDEDPEVRESMSKTLHPITRSIVGGSGKPLCARAICHKILNKLSLMWIEDPSETMKDNLLEIFQRLANTIKINEATEGLKSPFNQDETFHRGYTSFLNILFYCVRTLIERTSPTGISGIDSLEVQQINGIIYANNTIEREAVVDSTNFEIILQLSTSDYLSYKKRFLMKTIDEHRSVRDHQLIGDSNSP